MWCTKCKAGSECWKPIGNKCPQCGGLDSLVDKKPVVEKKKPTKGRQLDKNVPTAQAILQDDIKDAFRMSIEKGRRGRGYTVGP